jgi:tRNA A-37 threonylcarbamoyl transferase component Bud32
MPNPTEHRCPSCDARIADHAPHGLCPKCVLSRVAADSGPENAPPRSPSGPSAEALAPHFPDLEIMEIIGVGGMATVYRARQPRLDRFVALKVLSSRLSGDPAFVERFAREARTLARLNHPNIVAVFDCGVAGPFAYLLMEYVDGVNLRQAMNAGRFTAAEVLALAQDLCGALKFAHERGILHRDIKPENILIDSRGAVKVADFGIAKHVGEQERGGVTLTAEGAVLGSLHYMAPEQFTSPGKVDQRADIYSLGVVLYELLTGELPRGRFVPPSRKSGTDARLDEIVMRTLEAEREARFQTVDEVKTRVEALAPAKPADSGPPRPQETQMPGGTAALRADARLATLGAFITAASLVVAALGAAYQMMIHEMSKQRAVIPGADFVILAVSLILAGAPAIGGFLLGRRTLLGVRDSKGSRPGYTRGILAAMSWPILLGFILPSVLLAAASDSFGFETTLLHHLVVAVPVGTFAAFWMLRRVNQWVGKPLQP